MFPLLSILLDWEAFTVVEEDEVRVEVVKELVAVEDCAAFAMEELCGEA